jgi:hypothetical protein
MRCTKITRTIGATLRPIAATYRRRIKLAFDAAKAAIAASAISGGATDNGAAAIADAYHSTLVPPFCLSATKAFFDNK